MQRRSTGWQRGTTMSKTLYLECYSGISGDMTVAALLDLGADREVLKESLKSLPVGGFRTEITRVKKSGLDACDFSVILEQDNHDHDMEYLHGSEKSYTGHHEYTHSHEYPHEHRGMKEITEIIQKSEMTARAKKMAMRVFGILAQAESKAHGVPVEEVHFHEVGAVDSIVDIAAIAICMDNLDISNVIVPVLYEGTGFIRCQHGQIPVPVPAVTHIAETHKLKLKITDIQGEPAPPTGAAVWAPVRTTDRVPAELPMVQTGTGAGETEYRCPGILRAMLIRETTDIQIKDIIWKLETDMDDCGGEMMGHVMNLLMANGAREVHYTPIYTKKNRPAYTLTVICKESEREKLENLIFSETTTIGIRRVEMERTILQREIQKKDTPVGTTIVKACTLPDGNIRYYPEYENVAELAERNQLSFRETYDRIRSYWTTER